MNYARGYLGRTKFSLAKYTVAWEFGVTIFRTDTMIVFKFLNWHFTIWYRGDAKWRQKYIDWSKRRRKDARKR